MLVTDFGGKKKKKLLVINQETHNYCLVSHNNYKLSPSSHYVLKFRKNSNNYDLKLSHNNDLKTDLKKLSGNIYLTSHNNQKLKVIMMTVTHYEMFHIFIVVMI